MLQCGTTPGMSLLTCTGVTLRMGGRTLLDGADLAVDPGRRIGLVGRNGAGKSTLLKAISGDITVDGGDIRLSSRARVAQVKQQAPSGPATLLDTVLEGDPERLALLAEAERAEHGELPPDRVAAVFERLHAIGADAAPARAAIILAGLGFDAEAQGRPLDSFSGGWRMRVALATVLFSAPDLLLLDEPTNHLDLEATLWLEGWLARFPGAALVVSHDQGLLDRSVQAIAHLDRAQAQPHARRLRRVRPHPHRARHAAGPRRRAHHRAARPHASLRGPLPRPGQQSPASAVPAPRAGAHAGDGRCDRGRAHQVQLPRAGRSSRRRSCRSTA